MRHAVMFRAQAVQALAVIVLIGATHAYTPRGFLKCGA